MTPANDIPSPVLAVNEPATSPNRPHSRSLILFTGLGEARTYGEILDACLPAIARHLQSVCVWSPKGESEAWGMGEFSYFILEFRPDEQTPLYVQVWSEADEALIVEVSSGQANPPCRPLHNRGAARNAA